MSVKKTTDDAKRATLTLLLAAAGVELAWVTGLAYVLYRTLA